ncbi:MAG TPA: peptidylprolyl isomerase [Solirubrobacterales bacterium]|nr:peptidylprolyl isomerase [Solirubrobacterales bacterium]
MSAAGRKHDGASLRAKGRRLGLLAFGAAFVLLFAGVAIASGIGHPSVPSDAVAVIEDMPDGDLTITEEDFNRTVEQFAAQSPGGEVPAEDDPQYNELALAAFNDLLDIAWIEGEAIERGLSVSEREVREELEVVAQESFACSPDEPPFECREMRQFLNESGYTQEEVLDRIEVGVLSNELQTEITEEAPQPSESQVESFYESFKGQFEQPATTDLRVIQNEDRAEVQSAKQALEEDSSPEAWDRVAEARSTDPASSGTGGLREGVTEGTFQGPVQSAIDEAEPGALVGPIEAGNEFFLIQVEQRNPAGVQPLEEVREQIEQQVSQQLAASAQNEFINSYIDVWTARTFCAEDFLYERCANANGENVFLTAEMREQEAEATRDQAPAIGDRLAWPKPPNTMTLPVDPVTVSGTQILCYLAEQPEGQPFPLTGVAPPQRPHPPGPDEAINATPEGQDPASMPPSCGFVDPAAQMPGGQIPVG